MTMSALRAPIDYESLEEELHAALAADELYKLQNDAKLRAIEQGVPTYEHFRQMVNAAHLKSLDRNDMKPKIGVQWNPVTNRTRYPTVSATSKTSKFVRDDKHKSVRPSEPCEDFLRCWRTIEDHSERFAYMWNLRHVLQTRIFRVEIPAFFFGDFVSVCLDCISKMDDTTQITELLRILSTCSRFDLTICFMTKDEQVTCKQLFKQLRLKERSQDKSVEDALVLLAAKYQIDLD